MVRLGNLIEHLAGVVEKRCLEETVGERGDEEEPVRDDESVNLSKLVYVQGRVNEKAYETAFHAILGREDTNPIVTACAMFFCWENLQTGTQLLDAT